ncbi:MAG: serine/threonine-protein kinase [Pirellulales bacterium]
MPHRPTQPPTTGAESPPPHSDQRAPETGRCGPWRLLRAVGRGSLTKVYLARPIDGGDERPGIYALKLLERHWEDSPAAVETIRRAAAASVSHARLCPILSAHLAGPPYYLVMPWLEGINLADLLAAGWRPSPTLALWYARQAAEALDALASAGWTHGDVKPANLHVSPEGHVTLLDLGFARRADETEGSSMERAVAGTAEYLAPELAVSTATGDIRSDIYSLGITLFEMLTGQPPFAARDLGELIRQQREDLPRSMRNRVPHLPLELDRFVQRMIAKQPLRRPQTPRDIIDRLVRLEIEMLPRVA